MQRQLSLTDSKIQDYVEARLFHFDSTTESLSYSWLAQYASFRIERYDTMVMGLPPPEVHNLTSYRNFGLAHSIRDIFIQVSSNILSQAENLTLTIPVDTPPWPFT